MAICEFSPLISAIRASIGGTTFQANASGPIIRGKPHPPMAGLLSQRTAQQRFIHAAQLWRTLSGTVKADWIAYAATVSLYNSLHKKYSPTGPQIFTWLLTLQQTLGISPLVTTAPTGTDLATSPIHTIGWAGNNLSVSATSPTPAAGEKYMFRVFRPDIARAWPRTLLFNTLIFDGGTGQPWIIAASYKNLLKTGTLGRVHVHHRFFDLQLRSTQTLKTYLDFTAP